jgi:cytochrome c-type biogenesis protein CcmE
LTPYTSFAQARASRTLVQIIGSLDQSQTVEFDVGTGQLSFALTDTAGDAMPVLYTGSKPENFEHATEIGAIGKYADGYFLAQQLLVKCPSKYESEGEGQ